jgi:hypothetical protein
MIGEAPMFGVDVETARNLNSGLVRPEETEFTVDPEMAGYIQEYLDEVRALLFGGATLFTEQRVRLKGLADDVYGTADAVVISGDGKSIDVFDFKYGAGVFVPLEGNPQLLIYGLAAVLTHDLTNVETLTLHIVQPRHSRGGHHWQELPVSDVYTWFHDVLAPAIVRTKAPDPQLHAGDHCRFCDASSTCPELRSVALAKTRHLFDDGVLDEPLSPPPSPADMSGMDLAAALTAFPLIEMWMKAVREHANTLIRGGAEIPGYKLVRTVGNRKWTDESDVEMVLDAFLPEGASIYAPRKLVSPAQAEKLLAKGDRDIVTKLAHKPDTGTALMPSSDARPSIVSTVDVFDNLP